MATVSSVFDSRRRGLARTEPGYRGGRRFEDLLRHAAVLRHQSEALGLLVPALRLLGIHLDDSQAAVAHLVDRAH